ncbi:sulfatase, partial [Bacteroidota bacterium]|nr:sulfatase [Bacteroidota bacterium]
IYFICFSFNSQEKKNILWLVCEDQSLFFSSYYDSIAKTPNLDELASQGIIYDNFFAVSPVCSPSRSSIITGMYPTTIGTQHMRAYKKNKDSINSKTNLPFYSGVPKSNIKFFTENLRKMGYFCTNNSKEDYNMEMSPLAWNESNKNAHWRNRNENQPFFSVFNFNITHESRIWGNYKKHSIDEINKIILPPLFPNNNTIKNDFVTNYKNIEKLDKQVGEIIHQLKDDGLYENTVIFFFSDHGGPFPRYKRSIYDSGLKCPLIIKWTKTRNEPRNNQMISFIDLAPTILELTKSETNYEMEGVSFYNQNNRDYIFAATDRFDEYTDKRRCVRNKEFKLIINFDTNSSIMKPVSYRQKMKTMRVLDSLNDLKKNTISMENWYKKTKKKYELYDIVNDPYELNNLYSNKDYDSVFYELMKKLDNWIKASDYGNISENQLIKEMWPNGEKPKLKEPTIINKDNGINIISNNINSSIGWRNNNNDNWKIYLSDEVINPDKFFEIIVFKPGYGSIIKTFD